MAMVEKATEIFTTKLRINSQVYWIILSEKRECLIIEVYSIANDLPIQVKVVDSDVGIWERRKDLMGLKMTVGFVEDFFKLRKSIVSAAANEEQIAPSFEGHLTNGSRINLEGPYVGYLDIFMACCFVFITKPWFAPAKNLLHSFLLSTTGRN